MDMQVDSPSQVTVLQSQIQCLTDLYNHLQTIRQIPLILLHSPTNTFDSQDIRVQFKQLKEIGETVRSVPVQEALNRARESLNADSTNWNFNPRRENRKRRRNPSPESPRPYVNVEPSRVSLFPPLEGNEDPLTIDGLLHYVQEFNQKGKYRLYIWQRTRGMSLTAPRVLRFMIPDVLTAYISLGYTQAEPKLVIETVTAFAPREKKPPHSQSGYTVYRMLSQAISKMLHSQAEVAMQSVIEMLSSYSGLFIDRCASCERVLSAEEHVPPVVRLWKEKDGEWEPRHVHCR